jgi:hypothetical protein
MNHCNPTLQGSSEDLTMPSDEELDLITWESEGGRPAREIPADPSPELTELFRQLSGTYPENRERPSYWRRQELPRLRLRGGSDD